MHTCSKAAIGGEEEEASNENLCRAYYPRVMQLCRLLLTDPHDAAETAQEVFLKFIRARPVQTPIRSWEAWFTRVTVNACRDRRRSWWWRWWREDHAEFREDELPSLWRTPEEDALSREERERLWRAFQALPTRQREVFALHMEGWSHDVTAEMLGITVGSVKRHLFHAVRHLRTRLGEPA